jgi:hypothetical protein
MVTDVSLYQYMHTSLSLVLSYLDWCYLQPIVLGISFLIPSQDKSQCKATDNLFIYHYQHKRQNRCNMITLRNLHYLAKPIYTVVI